MKSFKYSSSQQPTIRVVETENPHHHYTYNHHPRDDGTTFSSAAMPPPMEDSELSIFDAQKYFNETNQLEKPKTNIIKTNPSLPPPPHENLPTSIPRRMSSSVASSAASDGVTYSANGGRVRRFSFPTASSEASWNSQTGLLANRPGSVQVKLRELQSDNEPRKRDPSSSWFFRLKCPCAGKKSIRVHGGRTHSSVTSVAGNNNTHHIRENHRMEVEKVTIKPQIIATQKEITVPISHPSEVINHNSAPPPIMIHHRQQRISSSGTGNSFHDGNSMAFSFPILNQFPPPAPKIEVLRRALPPLMAANDPPRDSLEVFQPQGDSIPSNKMIFPNNLSGGSGGGGGGGFPFLGSPTKAARDEDVMSDASSDLFEIESFSTQQTSSTYPMYYYQRRDSLEEASTFNARRRLAVAKSGGGMAACRNSYSRRSIDEDEVMNESEYCYEPSEASIDWSVTTADGFDRASMTNYSIAASEMEEPPVIRREWEFRGGGIGGGKGKNNKTKGIGLLSCRHENTVMSVGPRPMRCPVDER